MVRFICFLYFLCFLLITANIFLGQRTSIRQPTLFIAFGRRPSGLQILIVRTQSRSQSQHWTALIVRSELVCPYGAYRYHGGMFVPWSSLSKLMVTRTAASFIPSSTTTTIMGTCLSIRHTVRLFVIFIRRLVLITRMFIRFHFTRRGPHLANARLFGLAE